MLREIKSIRHSDCEIYKRWYIDADMDVRIWLRNGVPTRFEFNYDRSQFEHVLYWNQENGFSHRRICPAEEISKPRFALTPVTPSAVDFDAAAIARQFLQASTQMEVSLADFIYARLMEHPGPLAIRPTNKPVPAEY